MTQPSEGNSTIPLTPAIQDGIKALEIKVTTLELVRSRAEKWATTSTALTTLFGIGSVLTSIDSLPKIEMGWRTAIACTLLSGLAGLAASAYLLFPTIPILSDVDDLSTLARRIQELREETALKELKYLEWSKVFTGMGLFLISIAMAFSWFAPQMEDEKM